MATLKWRVKSRIETFLSHNVLFDDLTGSFLEGLPDNEVFFVIIGANDGIDHDHIYPILPKKKWSGVYVEPQLGVFEALVKNLKDIPNLHFENIAITPKEGQFDLFVPKDIGSKTFSGLGSLSRNEGVLNRFSENEMEKQIVTGKPFSFLVDKYSLSSRRNLLLVIDVEGHEQSILESIDFNLVKPSYIIYEHAHMTYDTHRLMHRLLTDNGYSIYLDKYDTLAVRR